MTTIDIGSRIARWKIVLAVVLCAAGLALVPNTARAQGLVEYAVFLISTNTVAAEIEGDPVNPGAPHAAQRMFAGAADAMDAFLEQDRALELQSLRKAEAAATSLQGIYRRCETESCESIKTQLELIRQLIAYFRAREL